MTNEAHKPAMGGGKRNLWCLYKNTTIFRVTNQTLLTLHFDQPTTLLFRKLFQRFESACEWFIHHHAHA